MSASFLDGNDAAIRAAEIDATLILGKYFDGVPGKRFAVDGDAETAVFTNAGSTAVAWRWSGVHQRLFEGIEPTGRPVAVSGMTVFSSGEKKPTVRRYIDWQAVFAQLGSVPGRSLGNDDRPATKRA
jgi:hypothetical protein